MDFKKSNVIFLEKTHSYYDMGEVLSGITSLIHDVKRVGVYEECSEYVKNYVIPRAAAYGTSIHKAIECYDKTGVILSNVTDKFGRIHDVSNEISNYIGHCKDNGYVNEANEFTVSYGSYASQIDNIWSKDGDIYLVDTKTNNTSLFPNGEDGLKEYLSWQLSCYKFMFEKQTGLKVKGLLANWLRHEEHALWTIEEKSEKDIEELLNTPFDVIVGDDHNQCRYYHMVDGIKRYYDTEKEESTTDITETNGSLLKASAIEQIMMVHHQYEHFKALEEEFKTKMLSLMSENDVKSFDCQSFKATVVGESTSSSIDYKGFFETESGKKVYEAYKDQIESCVKKTTRKAFLKVTFKNVG